LADYIPQFSGVSRSLPVIPNLMHMLLWYLMLPTICFYLVFIYSCFWLVLA